MIAVRRLLAVLCVLSVTALTAQTRSTKPAPQAPPPAPAPEAQVQPTEPATAPVTAETDKDLQDPRAMRLTLDDALATAMERNIGIQLQRYTYEEAGQSLRESWGTFDWLGTGTVSQQSTRSPTISTFQSTGSRASVFNLGLAQVIPTGGSYSVGFNNSRVTTAGGGTIVSPAYRSGLALAFTQPMFRNFGVDVTKRGIIVARNTLGIDRDVFRTTLMDTAVSVEQAYLNLVYARQFVDVVKEALFLARDQARITQIRIDVGASAPLDILQPRVQIATEEENLIVAEAAVRDAEDQLRALLHLDPGDWDRPIIPSSPVGYTPMTVNQDEAVARALKLRPELHETQLTTATKRIQYIYARNQVLPQVDLSLSYNAAGLSGRSQEIDPTTGLPTGRVVSTGYTDAVSQVFGNDFPSWTVGFNVGVPLTNIAARAEAKRTELDLALARTSEEQMRQTIVTGVRKAVRDVDTAAKQITATRTARIAAEQNLDAERKRYENGLATNFEVLQIQSQLSSARASELQALVGYNQAVAAYHRAVGDLLDVANIKVDEPAPVSEPRIFTALDRYNWLNYGPRIQDMTAGETKK